LCGKTLANNSIALSKIQRHLETNPKGHKYQIQNTNIVVLDQLTAETKTDLKL
jgi:hypothetical protein